MADRLLRKNEIAAMPGEVPSMAASILSRRGCQPVDLGYGCGKGVRWLESAVVAVMRRLHAEAQPSPQVSQVRRPKISEAKEMNLANMSTTELYESPFAFF